MRPLRGATSADRTPCPPRYLSLEQKGPFDGTIITMRVLLISANRTETNMRAIPLGLSCVGETIGRAGHAVRILDLIEAGETRDALSEAVRGFMPHVIGLSIRNIDDQNMVSPRVFVLEALAVIDEVRNLTEAPIVLGGAGYSMFPQEILHRSRADMGVLGAGEEVFTMIVDRLERKVPLAGIPGLYLREHGGRGRASVKVLDQVPLPGPGLLHVPAPADAIFPVQTRRGCPMRCSYCSTAAIEGAAIRKRSPEEVVKWIALWAGTGVRRFYFVDNTFNLPASYAKELCRELARADLGVRWHSIVYPFRMDESLADAMAESGCVEAAVGFESGCERMLRAMNKRFGREDIMHTCRVLKERSIRRMGFLLLGGPGETRESVEESLAFADSLDLEALKVSAGIRIYPHTRLADQAREEGVIGPEDDLLFPRFYLAKGLENWLEARVRAYAATRTHCILG